LKALAIKDENMNRFLRHVRLVDASESVGAAATDVILSLCYAKTSHGRLLQQFGVLEEEGGKGILLDSLALARRNLDIVCAFKSSDMEDERLHQDGPKLLKELLIWAEQLDDSPVNPTDFDEAKPEYDQDKAENKAEAAGARAEAFDSSVDSFNNVLFTDLADRIRARGLCVAVNYGFDKEHSIPLVVGLPDKPFALAVLTDDMRFMNIESTRERHRMFAQDLEYLGWSVMNVWSVGAFVNPEKEVERVVSRIGELYGEDQ
ncbi:helicase, partial [Gardnerella vaginalis]